MIKNYADHVSALLTRYQQAFEQLEKPLHSLLIHSGSEHFYYADDQTVPFRSFGHFQQWLPVNRADQMLLITAGKRPTYFQVITADYWYDQSIENASWWCNEFEIVTLTDSRQIAGYLNNKNSLGFIGENKDFACELGLHDELINCSQLLHYLDYYRAYKSSYEIEQIKSANSQALIGHKAAKRCFENGGSEYDIHLAYLQACNILEEETPYTNIVALNEKSAILHYQHKRRDSGDNSSLSSQVLLLDAGCRVNNYCSDITRTSTRPHTQPIFKSLVADMENMQLELISLIKPGLSYINLHQAALQHQAEILQQHKIINCSPEKALVLGLPNLFMPHGVGHLLGIQVHDVGGHQSAPDGKVLPPPEKFPFLRNTRIMDENMVFTVEPGLYFIPMLLNRERDSVKGKCLNWNLVDELMPLGGIRIEDNLLVTANGMENLTRQ